MISEVPISATEEQRTVLAILACSRDRGEADRARAVLFTVADWTSGRIAEAFRLRQDTVRLRCSNFMNDGVDEPKANVVAGLVPVRSGSGTAHGHAAWRAKPHDHDCSVELAGTLFLASAARLG